MAQAAGYAAPCAADGDSFRFDRSEIAAYVGYRSATFGPQFDDLRVAGTTYGLRQDVGLFEWLKLEAAFDSLTAHSEQAAAAHSAYRLERDSYRIGLAPRIDTDVFTLALSFDAMKMITDEPRDAGEFFGPGNRSRTGFGIGGSSTITLGPKLTVHGEASGCSLRDIEMFEASMRVSYRLSRHGASRLSLFTEGSERRYAKDGAELSERDLQFGISYRL